MDQDATWYGGRPRPRQRCVRWGPSSAQKGHSNPSIFGPRLLWPNSWMDQGAIWYEGRPQPRQHCVAWGPSSCTQKGNSSPHFSADVYCGQTAGWIKIPLGMEVGLGSGDIMLDGDPAPPWKGTQQPPLFGPCLLWPNGRPSQILWSSFVCEIFKYLGNR